MTVQQFTTLLRQNPRHELCFVLPDGGRIPVHAHITEVGRTDRRFLDCGGTLRHTSACTLQAWVAADIDHRLAPETLARIFEKAAALLDDGELPVEIEYEDGILSQFPVQHGTVEGNLLVFQLGAKHTDCLAKDVCLPPATADANACCSGGGCC